MPAERRGAISFNSGGDNNLSNSSTTSIVDAAAPSGSTSSNTMSPFSFGGTANPAPANSGAPLFGASFGGGGGGGSTSAPPAPTFGGFGSSASAPTPTTGGLFGSSPAPAGGSGGLFGSSSTPSAAPTSGFGGFGTTTTPALSSTGGGLFGGGTTPSPAPAFGTGLFGSSTPAPAPSSTGGFSSGSFGGFGTPAPAPAQAFGSFGMQPPTAATSLFAPQPVPAPTVPAGIAGQAFYSQLTQDQKNVLDEVHKAMMNHGRALASVSNMVPQLLEKGTVGASSADVAGGGQNTTLPQQMTNIKTQIDRLNNQIRSILENLHMQKEEAGKCASMATAYALWPTEALAKRNGITIERPQSRLLTEEEKKQEDNEKVIQEIFDRARLRVDELQRMPSPYMWDLITEMEHRAHQLHGQLHSLQQATAAHKKMKEFEAAAKTDNTVEQIVQIVSMHDSMITKVRDDLARAHIKVDELRRMYSLLETGENVIHAERERAIQRERMLEQRQRMQLIKSLSTPTTIQGSSSTPSTPAAAPPGFGFGSSPAPAQAFGGFGGTTPAPAPSGGSLFSSTTTTAPSPASGSAFSFGGGSSTPAPATGSAFGFGSTTPPAPAPGGIFSTPAEAPGAAPAFGATSLTPKSKQRSRSTRRR